ncbi:hypothetical protein OPQ81_002875 [Rhizoctonia solani]|nr:hypothetical protein OPQ81_002875 [Rhizoctonia solani]
MKPEWQRHFGNITVMGAWSIVDWQESATGKPKQTYSIGTDYYDKQRRLVPLHSLQEHVVDGALLMSQPHPHSLTAYIPLSSIIQWAHLSMSTLTSILIHLGLVLGLPVMPIPPNLPFWMMWTHLHG